MPNFYEQPILNSPYECPAQYWELGKNRRPTHKVLKGRRPADFITPIPSPRRQGGAGSAQMEFGPRGEALSDAGQQYESSAVIINSLRQKLEKWREKPEHEWGVTPTTARLLKHWRHHQFNAIRPFFCQVEAVEAVIWLTEVAPTLRDTKTRQIIERLRAANQSANPELSRLALKLATGAGKTTVMAMLVAWQTLNAARHPNSSRFTRGFLVVTPGITIRDRLRVLQPNDPDSYYKSRELVPQGMLGNLLQAKIVIANYHALMLRERMHLTPGNRRLLQGRAGAEPDTKETEGQMLKRVMSELMGMRNIMAFNDEGHHCYRERPPDENEEAELQGEEEEAKKNREAARVWISGLEIAQRELGLSRILDLSATPFFLRGSGYAEGTLFPWTLCDFSLMDAIECGIVKLPRVPVADNTSKAMPMYRNLWEHIGGKMPKAKRGRGRAKAAPLDPLDLPIELENALQVLYGHYEKVFKQWQDPRISIKVPPCFIVVCNNTDTSKLVYDYIAGFYPGTGKRREKPKPGLLPLFSNFDEDGKPYPLPRTVLIDSKQLESGGGLEKNFRDIAADEIERFRREIEKRTDDRKRAADISAEELLREVMNTVGKEGRLGASIRCVVSVSMLTEGWDANTVTHVLGVRAFGTQLLCEQVVGRALRRQSYDLNENGLFNVEYADVLGIPFDFTDAGGAAAAPTPPPRLTVRVHALSPERDACEIRFPKVKGYHVEPPREELSAKFNDDSTLELTPELFGPTITHNEGILGKGEDLTLEHTNAIRLPTIAYHLAKHLLETKWQDEEGNPKLYLFGQLKCIALQWLDKHLVCKGNTHPAQLLYKELKEKACEQINQGIVAAHIGEQPVIVILDPYNPRGSTAGVDFPTSKPTYDTDARFCHVNKAAYDSDWEAEFCRMAESHPQVRAYVKNQGLDFTVPYRDGPVARDYLPDFIVRVDDGHDEQAPLNLVVEVKGRRGENAKVKKETMENYWIPGVKRLGGYGRWAFVELRDVYNMEEDFNEAIGRCNEGSRVNP